ncbi:MAG: hypothetical protein J0L61_11235 [Planctomycetes bacterium]|nr:hypothetical protein [Planctomycetota bacterium]
MTAQESLSPPPKPRKPGFSLHWTAVTLWGVFILAALAIAATASAFSELGRAYRLGSGLGVGTLLCLGVSWVVFRLAGRSKFAASVTFGALNAIAVGLLAVVVTQSIRAARQSADLVAATNAAQVRQLEAAKQGDVRAMNAEADRQAEELRSRAAGASGNHRLGLETSSELIEELAPIREEMATAHEAFVTAGGIDASTLGTPQMIEQRIEMVDRIIKSGRALEAKIVDMLGSAKRKLSEKGADPKYADEWFRGFAGSVNEPFRVKARRLGNDIYTAMRRVLEIHLEQFGNISVNEEGEVVADMPDEILEEFNRLIDEIAALGEEQMRIIEEQQRLKGGERESNAPAASAQSSPSAK